MRPKLAYAIFSGFQPPKLATASESLLRNLGGLWPPKVASATEGGERGINFIDPCIGVAKSTHCLFAIAHWVIFYFAAYVKLRLPTLQNKKCPATPGNELICGERGIRTPGTFYSTPDFESGTLNRSDISPVKILGQQKYENLLKKWVSTQ